MIPNWFNRIFGQKKHSQDLQKASRSLQSPSITSELPEYQQTLNKWNHENPQSMLAVLLTRDRVETIRKQDDTPSAASVHRLVDLDKQLRQQIKSASLQYLSDWRRSLNPPQSHWWWFLDEDKDLLLEIVAVTFFILTIPLATDIIRRLWAHAPDNIAIISTLLILLITASPFTQRGRELVQWLLRRVPRLPIQLYGKTMATTAFLAFVLVAGVRFLFLPWLANLYNDQGVTYIEQGQLTIGRQKLQQAIAINNDLAPSYYNLAAAYETIGRYDEAINWYENALDEDLDFASAYNNMGRIYLEQGDPEEAQKILVAGMAVLEKKSVTDTEKDLQQETVTRYRLLTHLGQAHYEQDQFTLAVQRLEEAVSLENEEELDVSYFGARPHYYLALTYERLEHPTPEIITQWEAALSYYLTGDDPFDWQITISEHLNALREGTP